MGGSQTSGGRARPQRRARARGAARVAAIVLVTLAVCLLTGSYSPFERRLVEGVYDDVAQGAFYVLPDPLPAGKPGEVIRAERLPGALEGSAAWRVLYHSTDVFGHDIAVSGVVFAPDGPAPRGGRTVVSWGHPTTGTAAVCAPSLNVESFGLDGLLGDAIDPFGVEGLAALLGAGYVVAATDYPGMGAAGPDAYLVGTSEGNSVLDAARAAGHLPETGASARLLLWGHSQGGHAALFAAQDAATYAPELTLLGVAVAAPATQLGSLLKADIGDVSGVSLGAYAFASYASVYGPSTPGAALSTILTPAGAQATPQMNALCLSDTKTLHGIAGPLVGAYLTGDPTVVEPWASLLAANTPGPAAAGAGKPIPVPLFVAQGGSDTLVRPADTAAFAQSECAAGARVTYLAVPNTTHGLIALRAAPTVLAWFARLDAGQPVASTC